MKDDSDPDKDEPQDLRKHYLSMMSPIVEPGGEGVESAGPIDAERPDLSNSAIDDRLSMTRGQLYQIVRKYLGDSPKLYKIADKMISDGGEALRVLRDGDEGELRGEGVLRGLEAIVRTDGSRPSFMIQNGQVDKDSSIVGTWDDPLDTSADLLKNAIACVGRIDMEGSPQGFQGTGFLVHRDAILTNRHVLQAIADRETDKTWTLRPGVSVDFGHEFRIDSSSRRRTIKGVRFAAAKPILSSQPIDHAKCDLVVIELEPTDDPSFNRPVMAIDKSTDWASADASVYVIGYPGAPAPGSVSFTLLEQLFQSTFGCKRLAPGVVIKSAITQQQWTLTHDATTLGGNSGSVLVVIGREGNAAGLHYGGRGKDPKENWGHILGMMLDEPDGLTGDTLGTVLDGLGVQFVDRKLSGSETDPEP